MIILIITQKRNTLYPINKKIITYHIFCAIKTNYNNESVKKHIYIYIYIILFNTFYRMGGWVVSKLLAGHGPTLGGGSWGC
jgi:hypothetical protein